MRGLLILAMFALVPAFAQAATWDDCMQNDDVKKKVSACTRVIDSKSTKKKDQTTALLHRAYAHRRLKSWDEALADADEVIQRSPTWGRAYYERGMVLRQREEFRAAVRDFDVAVRAMSDKPFVWLARGRVNHHLGNYWSAAQDISEAIRLNPEYAIAYGYRAQVRCRQDRPEAAAQDWLAMFPHDRDEIADMKAVLRKHGLWDGDDRAPVDEPFRTALRAYTDAGCPGH